MAAPHQRATRGANGGNRAKRPTRLTTEAAKNAFVEHIKTGMTVASALEKIGYAQKTYEEWRRKDADFKSRVDQARQLRKPDRGVERGERMGFAEWRKKYLGVDTPWHQMQWVDMLENREPRDLHDSQVYEQNRRDRIMVNCPPFHGKSVAITIDYATYRLCMDPSFRIIIISAGQGLAQDFLFGIKQRLTSPDFLEMQLAYAPDGGWEATAESWTESKIVFGSEVRSQGRRAFHEKDANVIALGMRSKVYGRRADLIIVDDGVDTTNVSEHAKQMKWLRSMVETRIEAGGKLLVVGTRVASIDLYSELRNPENYANGKVPWTYLASPAILHEGETPEEHVTLWPRAQVPWVHPDSAAEGELCLCENPACSEGFEWGGRRVYARWDGLHLELGPRAANSATDWALIFQQSSVSENSTFPEFAVKKATNSARMCGRLEADKVGHPYAGMHDKYIIGGCDPAISGFAGLVVIAVDKDTQKRFVLTAVNLKAPTTKELQDRMKELTEFYGIHEWRVEKTGLLKFFTQHAEFRVWFQTRGVKFTEHETGSNKWDLGYGVSSMASLFGEYDKAWDDPNGGWRTITEPLIELPRPNQEGMKALVHQLIIWTPELNPAKVPCDLVMALWFANTGAREFLGIGRNGNVVAFGRNNKFVSPRRKNHQRVSLADYRQANN
jgi:hypothetical protein